MDMSTTSGPASIPTPRRARRSPAADELRAGRASVETPEAATHVEEGAHLHRRASAPHVHAIPDTSVAPLSSEQIALVEEAMSVLRAHGESLGAGRDRMRPVKG
jgi:hypothetical protein